MDNEQELRPLLEKYKLEHRLLDERISEIMIEVTQNNFELQRLKREKLLLKDKIAKIENALLPDIIA